MRRFALFCVLCAAFSAGAFPDRTVQLIVPYPPGGSNDILARAVGNKLAERLGKPVVIDNRAGAGGSIGAELAAKAAPDGHTIAIVSSSFTTNAAVQALLPFDPVKSFTPVAMVGKGPLVLVVSNGVPAKSAQEFFALRPGTMNYASSGAGSINQFATELLKAAAAIDLTHVPYKGMGPATADVIGGHVDALVASVPSVMQHVKSGKLRGLGVTTLEPSPAAPGLAPLAAAGAKGYDVELWWGILAPAGLPAPALARLNSEINRIIMEPGMKEFLLKEGAEPAPMTPQAFGALIGSEIERWKRVAAAARIRAE
jgi:tripartite-type tricarboxylate transporter receptor subunit TctC